jgi:hypothetical protein
VLGSGNNRITIASFANSADAQVGQKVIWIKNVTTNQTIHYYHYATNDNTTTTFILTSPTPVSTSIVYEYDSLDNGLPPAGTYVFAFANRLWLVSSNVVYYSNKAYNEYDLEIFPASNFVILPHNCTGLFSVGTNLYANTDNGIMIIPSGDPTAIWYIIEPRWRFVEMRTVARWNNGVMGLTNDGVRYFDGERFTTYDMSMDIKSKIDKAYTQDTNFKPCGFIYRRDFRNEYHLLWQDVNVSATVLQYPRGQEFRMGVSAIFW